MQEVKLYKCLWNYSEGQVTTVFFNEDELNSFWDLKISAINKLLIKTQLSINECLYPYEEKLVDIFYLAFAKYVIKNKEFDYSHVINYLQFLIANGWNFNKHKSQISLIIKMLKCVRNNESINNLSSHDLFKNKEEIQ